MPPNSSPLPAPLAAFARLYDIVMTLRDPVRGCPWDIEQTHESLRGFAVEEAHELADAIKNKPQDIPNELGDVLLQVLLHAAIGQSNAPKDPPTAPSFSLEMVITQLADKLIERHPHVFQADGTPLPDDTRPTKEEVLRNWELQKKEKAGGTERYLAGILTSAPALFRAHEIGRKCAKISFDWGDLDGVCAHLRSELDEFDHARNHETPAAALAELGDLLFTAAQVARLMGTNAEELAEEANKKFLKRFSAMEDLGGKPIESYSREELSALWQQVKLNERSINTPPA